VVALILVRRYGGMRAALKHKSIRSPLQWRFILQKPSVIQYIAHLYFSLWVVRREVDSMYCYLLVIKAIPLCNSKSSSPLVRPLVNYIEPQIPQIRKSLRELCTLEYPLHTTLQTAPWIRQRLVPYTSSTLILIKKVWSMARNESSVPPTPSPPQPRRFADSPKL